MCLAKKKKNSVLTWFRDSSFASGGKIILLNTLFFLKLELYPRFTLCRKSIHVSFNFEISRDSFFLLFSMYTCLTDVLVT